MIVQTSTTCSLWFIVLVLEFLQMQAQSAELCYSSCKCLHDLSVKLLKELATNSMLVEMFPHLSDLAN